MANRDVLRRNQLIDMAPSLYSSLKKEYLAGTARTHDGISMHPVDDLAFYRIHGYAAPQDAAAHWKMLQDAANTLLGVLYSYGQPFACCVVCIDGSVALYFGVAPEAAPSFRGSVLGALPGAKLTNEFVPMNVQNRLGAFGGVITGTPGDGLFSDNLLGSLLSCGEGAYLLLCAPYNTSQIRGALAWIEQARTAFSPLAKTTQAFGSGTKRTLDVAVQSVQNLLDTLELLNDRCLTALGTTMWRACLWCSSSSRERALQFSAAYGGQVPSSWDGKSFCEQHRYTPIEVTPLAAHALFFAENVLPSFADLDSGGLLFDRLCMSLLGDELMRLLVLPRFSASGFHVYSADRAPDDKHLFDVNVPEPLALSSVCVGRLAEDGAPYSIDLRDMMSHTAIFGVNGFGKTNTAQVILSRLAKKGISFLVIEPVKKQHWQLAVNMRLNVYSAGEDALPLRFNPLQPMPGVSVGSHIERLMLAFSSQSEMEAPLPEVLRMLLDDVYTQFGFPAEHIVLAGEQRQYPNLADVLERYEAFLDTHTHHSERVRQDIKGAIHVRLKTLLTGEPGLVLNTHSPLDVKILFEHSAVIELDDLSDGAKNFTMSALMCLIDEYLRLQPESASLRRVIVLEEAHRFFVRQPAVESAMHSKELASQYFSNLLSEIRAHGCGVMVIDQRPSLLNGNAIANTVVKVVHALADEADADAVAYSLRLNPLQKRLMRDMPRGRAVVGVIGRREVCQVDIDRMEDRAISPYACIFCRKECRYPSTTTPPEYPALRYHGSSAAAMARAGADVEAIAARLRIAIGEYAAVGGLLSHDDEICLAGCMLEGFDIPTRILRKIMYAFARRPLGG